MLVLFDLDGVLLDSQDTVLRAYERAGVTAPKDIFAKEGTHWLQKYFKNDERAAIRAHHAKNMAYLDYIGDAPKLPPFDVARDLPAAGHVIGVLTGAPIGTMYRLQRVDDTWRSFTYTYEGARFGSKEVHLNNLSNTLPQVRKVYVDDRTSVVMPPDWHFVHYNGQSALELNRQIHDIHVRGGHRAV